jgi:3-oxoacyl-[acyl-carrier protein] reductase
MVGMTVDVAGKAALDAHTLNLARELESSGVTVNAYRPGAVDTAMQWCIRARPPQRIGNELHERFVAMRRSGTLLTAEESTDRLLGRLKRSVETGQIWTANDAPSDRAANSAGSAERVAR